MSTRSRGPIFSVLAALLMVSLVAGCGGGGTGGTGTPVIPGEPGSTGTASANGVTVTATVSGAEVDINARISRRNIAQAWVEITGINGQVSLVGSGDNWSGRVTIPATAGSVITVKAYALDSAGTTLGPATVQVLASQFGAQAAVTGTVVRAGDNTPLAGATVSLGSFFTTTQANGTFSLVGVEPGETAELVVTMNGYAEARRQVTTTTGTVSVGTITLTASQDLPPAPPQW